MSDETIGWIVSNLIVVVCAGAAAIFCAARWRVARRRYLLREKRGTPVRRSLDWQRWRNMWKLALTTIHHSTFCIGGVAMILVALTYDGIVHPFIPWGTFGVMLAWVYWTAVTFWDAWATGQVARFDRAERLELARQVRLGILPKKIIAEAEEVE